MAQNITIMGASYPDVPAVTLPKTGGGTARFDDCSVVTANASDVFSGKIIVDSSGNITPGTAALTVGTLRPDAELVKTFSYDKYITADEGITIPEYTTTQTTLKATETLQETYTITYTGYNWYVLLKTLTIPEYSVTSKAKGRQEYHFSSTMYEVVDIEANTMKAISDPTKNVSRSVTFPATGVNHRLVYWSSGTAIAAYSTSAYGAHQNIVAPTYSSSVITFNTPDLRVRGSTSYFVNTYMNALTDIRYQWVIQVYRAPKSNLNFDGWGQVSQARHIISCAQSSTHKLT